MAHGGTDGGDEWHNNLKADGSGRSYFIWPKKQLKNTENKEKTGKEEEEIMKREGGGERLSAGPNPRKKKWSQTATTRTT